MRKGLSLLLAVALIFSLAVPALAATVNQSATVTALNAGEEFTITVTLDETLEKLIAFDYELYYDSTLFELVSGTPGDVSNVAAKTDSKGNAYVSINKANLSGDGTFSVQAGTLATLTFKALESVTGQQLASFRLEQETLWDDSWSGENIADGTVATPELSITINPEPATYTVTLPQNPVGYTITPTAGSENPVAAGGSYSFTITVDTDNYEGTPVVKANDQTLALTEGVYTISNITEDQTVTVEGIQEQGLAADQVIYQNGSHGRQWPYGVPVYINTLTLKGLSVANVSWDSAFENCTITLHKKTADDAAYSISGKAVCSGPPQMAASFTATINEKSYSAAADFIYSGSLENGKADIVVTASAQNYSGTKNFHLIVDDTSTEPEPEPATYEVTLTEGTGYTITAAEGSSSPVAEGGSFSFTVTVSDGFEGTPVVKANGNELTAENDVYTITDIAADQLVTVEGITAIPNTCTVTLTEGTGYTIAAAEGSSSPVTEGGSFSFTVTLCNGYEGTPVVKANGHEVTALDGVYTIESIIEDQIITVEGIAIKANTYLVAASADVTASKDDKTSVSVNVTGNSNAEITGYNDYDMTISYDPDVLTYESAAAAHSGAEITHDAETGTIRVIGHGEEKSFADAVVTLSFTAKESGIHTVNVTSAKIDNSGNAIEFNAPEAAVTDQDTAVKVAYAVTLPEGFEGEPSVLPGENYQFTAPSEYYDITVTVGGQQVEPSADGLVYTISNVNGDVVVTADGKTYEVTKTGEHVTFTGEDVAQYGEDYAFTVTAEAGYTVTEVSVKIGDTDADYSIIDGSYVISGNDITGNVTITAATREQDDATTLITFEGVTASEVVGGLTQYAANGTDFTFELNEQDGYVYTARLGDMDLNPAAGVYTIPGSMINGTALTVTITKAVYSFNPEVTVSQYIQLDETVMWLVTATEGENKLAYGEGNTMYWSDAYSAYCWLVISDKDEETVLAEAKQAIIPAGGTTAEKVAYDRDVNQTGEVDVNDAQLTYDMYQARKYSDFDTVTMDKFLEADVNGDKIVSVEDARAVVSLLLE